MADQHRRPVISYAATCKGKAGFANGGQAWEVVRRQHKQRKRGKSSGAVGRAYRCPFCGHWHIGRHAPPPEPAS